MEVQFFVVFSCFVVFCAGYYTAPKCGKNEYLSECANGCDPVDCPKSYKEELAWRANCFAPAVCLPTECRCIKDHRRDSNGRCIYIGECPGICPKNEEFSNCTQACGRAQNCSQTQPITNTAVADGSCQSGCICKKGMLRDDCGKCVPEDECPAPPQPQCGQNEVLSCVHECPPEKTCETRGIEFDCIKPTKKCEEKCVCKPGYYRNALKVCVTDEECAPPQPQCGQNEVLSCVHDCPPEKTCKTRGIQFRCQKPTEKCKEKCICKPGHYRNAIGDCITDEECDMCKGVNEFFSCGTACDNRCSDIGTQNRTSCPILNIVCNRKCYCEDGFARDDKEQCIPVEDCPKCNTCNGPNEEYVKCKQTCPPKDLCESIVSRYDCKKAPPCKPGCTCKSGFFRKDENSPCDKICNCPQMQGSPDCPPKKQY